MLFVHIHWLWLNFCFAVFVYSIVLQTIKSQKYNLLTNSELNTMFLLSANYI